MLRNLLQYLGFGITAFGILQPVNFCLAEDVSSRSIQGGDLVFSTSSTGNTQEEAVFKAEAQAVRMITIECSIPHRDTKIFDQRVDDFHGRFHAHVSAGLALSSCEEAQNASAETKKSLTSETLAESQKVYNSMLYGERKPASQSNTQANIRTNTQVGHYQFTSAFNTQYQGYLSSQTDCREKARSLLRDGNDAQADLQLAKCR